MMDKRFFKTSFMKKLLQIFIIFVLFAFAKGDTRSFYDVPRAASSIYSEDFDMDGDFDIIVGHYVNPNIQNIGISFLTNNGFGLMDCDSFYYAGFHSDVKVALLNNNQQSDLITQTWDGQDFYVGIIFDFIENQSNTQAIPVPEHIEPFAIGDVDNNSANDILFASQDGQFWGVIYNDGMGNFTNPEYHFVDDYYPNDIACGDLNDDGRNDVVVCGQSTEVYFSYPNGFDFLLLETNDFKSDVFITDFDLDGDNDIITISGMAGYTTVVMYNNLNDNTFERIDNLYFQQITSSYCISDFNNDNLPDILFHYSIASAYIIYFNKGDFQLGNPKIVPLGSTYEALKQTLSADIDGNGHNDIVTLCTYPFSRLIASFNDGNGNFVENPIVAVVENELSHSGLTCYPNPFSGSTKIRYTVENKAIIQLNIYNYAGQLIKSIDEGTQPKGTHFIEFDAKGLKDGIYLYSISINGKTTDSKKMTIMN